MSDIKKKESDAAGNRQTPGRTSANTLSEVMRIPGVNVKPRKK